MWLPLYLHLTRSVWTNTLVNKVDKRLTTIGHPLFCHCIVSVSEPPAIAVPTLRPFVDDAFRACRDFTSTPQAPHVSQSCQWDCGVSCVQMVLRGLGREAERSSLLASLGTRSVWTIDLAMLLHRQGVRSASGEKFFGASCGCGSGQRCANMCHRVAQNFRSCVCFIKHVPGGVFPSFCFGDAGCGKCRVGAHTLARRFGEIRAD